MKNEVEKKMERKVYIALKMWPRIVSLQQKVVWNKTEVDSKLDNNNFSIVI